MGSMQTVPMLMRLSIMLAGVKYPDICTGDCKGTWGCREIMWGPAHQMSGPGKRHLSIFRWNGHSGYAFLGRFRTFSPINQLPPSFQLGENAHISQRVGSPCVWCLLPPCSHLLPPPSPAGAAVCPAAGRCESICHPSAGLSPLLLPPTAKLSKGSQRSWSREGA